MEIPNRDCKSLPEKEAQHSDGIFSGCDIEGARKPAYAVGVYGARNGKGKPKLRIEKKRSAPLDVQH